MCSVQDGEMPVRRVNDSKRQSRVCMKCKEENAILVTRVNDAFCRACFQVYVTHKFRAAIGKTKLVRDGERVLVAFSGGPSSSALLNLIQEGLSERAHKKLRFRPGVIFLDEGGAVGLTPEERQRICSRVKAVLLQTGFTYYIKTLEEGLDLDAMLRSISLSFPKEGQTVSVTDCDTCVSEDQENSTTTLAHKDNTGSSGFQQAKEQGNQGQVEEGQNECLVHTEAERNLKHTLDSIKSVTAKQDFIRSLRHRILLEVAQHCGYSKVMLGSCGTQLAVRLLSNISTGRGTCAAMESAFADRRNENMLFLRPMRDFSSKEVAMYNNLHNVEPVFIPTLTTKGETGVSIEHLTEAFVTGLQADYPSTVSNIMRTGEKLDSSAENVSQHCVMCQGPLDTDVGPASALSAVEFSQNISISRRSQSNIVTKKGDNCSKSSECCGEGDGSCQSMKLPRLDADDVLTSLCYGCRIVARELNDVCKLPQFVIEEVAKNSRRLKMKSEIQEFLINDS